MIEVFLDTETTGVHRGYRPWDIAMVRRDGSGGQQELTIFVDVADIDIDHADPEALIIGGFEQRHPQRGGRLATGQVLVSGYQAAQLVQRWTDSALVYGVNPSYDTIGLDGLLARANLDARWYYAPQDLVGIAYGFMLRGATTAPPRSSEPLSMACGVDIPQASERHTAMGDARWAARWYDALRTGITAEVAA